MLHTRFAPNGVVVAHPFLKAQSQRSRVGTEPARGSLSGGPDDRALFALERPALCEALPDIAAVLASPAYRGFIEYARTLAQLLTSETYQSFIAEHYAAQEARRDAESRAERKANVITHNALARSAAAGRCPRCAATDLRRVAPADHRRAYYSCLGCGRTFGADLL